MCHTEVNLRSCLSYSVLNWLVPPPALRYSPLCFALLWPALMPPRKRARLQSSSSLPAGGIPTLSDEALALELQARNLVCILAPGRPRSLAWPHLSPPAPPPSQLAAVYVCSSKFSCILCGRLSVKHTRRCPSACRARR
jgi:hypothetical protein